MDDEALNFDLLAASLRADLTDMPTWVATMGNKLANALPVRVQLHHAGLFGNGAVDGMAADLGDWRYALHLVHGRPLAERTHIVRGIALKTEPLALDAWVDALADSLADIAATSARERAAIMRLLA